MAPQLSGTSTLNATRRPSAARPLSRQRPKMAVSILPPHSSTTTLKQTGHGTFAITRCTVIYLCVCMTNNFISAPNTPLTWIHASASIFGDPLGIQVNLQHNSRPPAILPEFGIPGYSSSKQLKMCQHFTNLRSSVTEFSDFKFTQYIGVD